MSKFRVCRLSVRLIYKAKVRQTGIRTNISNVTGLQLPVTYYLICPHSKEGTDKEKRKKEKYGQTKSKNAIRTLEVTT